MLQNRTLHRVVLTVALANLAYFFVEFSVAVRIGSVSLFADSIDFLEDASVNLLIFFALSWTASLRAKVGMFMAALLMVPAVATLWSAWQQITSHHPPTASSLSLVGCGALIINLSCAFLLAKFRHHGGSLTKAAFLSARNDALANIAIIAAGFLTMLYPSIWPDIIVGLGIAAMNADAAREVFHAAHGEYKDAKA